MKPNNISIKYKNSNEMITPFPVSTEKPNFSFTPTYLKSGDGGTTPSDSTRYAAIQCFFMSIRMLPEIISDMSIRLRCAMECANPNETAGAGCLCADGDCDGMWLDVISKKNVLCDQLREIFRSLGQYEFATFPCNPYCINCNDDDIPFGGLVEPLIEVGLINSMLCGMSDYCTNCGIGQDDFTDKIYHAMANMNTDCFCRDANGNKIPECCGNKNPFKPCPECSDDWNKKYLRMKYKCPLQRYPVIPDLLCDEYSEECLDDVIRQQANPGQWALENEGNGENGDRLWNDTPHDQSKPTLAHDPSWYEQWFKLPCGSCAGLSGNHQEEDCANCNNPLIRFITGTGRCQRLCTTHNQPILLPSPSDGHGRLDPDIWAPINTEWTSCMTRCLNERIPEGEIGHPLIQKQIDWLVKQARNGRGFNYDLHVGNNTSCPTESALTTSAEDSGLNSA